MDKLLSLLADKIGAYLLAKQMAILPIIVTAAVKALADQVGIKVEPEVLMDKVREHVNQIPDIDIPVLSEVFDLTEFLKGLGR